MTTLKRGPSWISGPDALHHKMYVAFGYHRVTSRLRGDTWRLTWPEWRDIWLPFWDQRGRSREQLCMCRKDVVGEWSTAYVHLLTRRQHIQQVRAYYK